MSDALELRSFISMRRGSQFGTATVVLFNLLIVAA